MKNYGRKVTGENINSAVKDAFFEIKKIKPEDIFGYVLLTDYGVTAPEVDKLARKVAEHFEFPDELDEDDISYFFGQQDWKTLTIHLFTECCIDLICYKVLVDL